MVLQTRLISFAVVGVLTIAVNLSVYLSNKAQRIVRRRALAIAWVEISLSAGLVNWGGCIGGFIEC